MPIARFVSRGIGTYGSEQGMDGPLAQMAATKERVRGHVREV